MTAPIVKLAGPTPLQRVDAALSNADFHLSENGRTTHAEIEIVFDVLEQLRDAVHALAEQAAMVELAQRARQTQPSEDK